MMEAFLVVAPLPWLWLLAASWLKWIALAIAAWALFGARRNAPARCARCGYTLDPSQRSNCSECGADLSRRGAVREFARVAHKRALALSAALMAVSLACCPIIGFWPIGIDEAKDRTYGSLVQERFDPITGDFASAWLSPPSYIRWTIPCIERTQPLDRNAVLAYYDWHPWFTSDRLASPARIRALHDAVLDPETHTGAAIYAARLADCASAPSHSSMFVEEPLAELTLAMLRDALVADPTLLEIPLMRSLVLARNFDAEGGQTLMLNSVPEHADRDLARPIYAYFGSRTLDAIAEVSVVDVRAELTMPGEAPQGLVPDRSGTPGMNPLRFDFSGIPTESGFGVRIRCSIAFTVTATTLRDERGELRRHDFRIAVDASASEIYESMFP